MYYIIYYLHAAVCTSYVWLMLPLVWLTQSFCIRLRSLITLAAVNVKVQKALYKLLLDLIT